jgi:hypothetical protein
LGFVYIPSAPRCDRGVGHRRDKLVSDRKRQSRQAEGRRRSCSACEANKARSARAPHSSPGASILICRQCRRPLQAEAIVLNPPRRMSVPGQNRKSSMRADVFRFAPESGHRAMQSACPFGARNGSPPTIRSPRPPGRARRAALLDRVLWQFSC